MIRDLAKNPQCLTVIWMCKQDIGGSPGRIAFDVITIGDCIIQYGLVWIADRVVDLEIF